VSRDVQNTRIARVDDDVVDEHARLAEVVEELPVFAGVG
jgi:hypothetical protein